MDTACFTGHRPEAFKWGYDGEPSRDLMENIYNQVVDAVDNGAIHFITGGALGFDTYAAEAVLKARDLYAHTIPRKIITLEIAVPCATQWIRWRRKDIDRYNRIKACADKVTILSDSYTPWCMSARNVYMVDHSDRVIACFNGFVGGTANCIEAAKERKKEIINIWKPEYAAQH